MDFSLNSSVVLAAIVGLWLIWVAPYLLRHRQPLPVAGPASIALPGITTGDAGFPRSVMTMSAADDSRPVSGPSTAGRAGVGSSKVQASTPGLNIRWGRLSIALVGAVGLATALVTSVLAVVGLVPSIVPVIALVLAVASVSVLRTLAVRGRRSAGQQAPAAAEEPAAPMAPRAPVVQRPTTLFNAEDAGDRSPEEESRNDDGAAPAQFTAAELRAAALAVAAEAGEKPVVTGTPWQPVDVPKPTYVAAPKADREDPAPLDLPETPKPQAKTPIKSSAAAPTVETSSAPRMNLDDILQRRRA